MICSFPRTSASLAGYIQYFFFISIIKYEVPLTSSFAVQTLCGIQSDCYGCLQNALPIVSECLACLLGCCQNTDSGCQA